MSKVQPVELSLRGDGRLLALAPATVRTAFFHFFHANKLSYLDLRPFEAPGQQSPGRETTLLNRLFHRKGEPPYLTASEIRHVESHLNRMLIQSELSLVEGEGRIHEGTVAATGVGLGWRRTLHVIRYGVIFELRSLRRDELLRGGPRDIVVEDSTRQVRVVRYLGVASDHRKGRVVLRFAHRLDLARAWTVPQGDFDCRQLFAVGRLAACAGFRLTRVRLNSG